MLLISKSWVTGRPFIIQILTVSLIYENFVRIKRFHTFVNRFHSPMTIPIRCSSNTPDEMYQYDIISFCFENRGHICMLLFLLTNSNICKIKVFFAPDMNVTTRRRMWQTHTHTYFLFGRSIYQNNINYVFVLPFSTSVC